MKSKLTMRYRAANYNLIGNTRFCFCWRCHHIHPMVVPKSLDCLYPPRLCRFFFLVSDTHRNRTAAFLDYHVSTFYSTSPIFTSHSFRSAVGTTEGYLDLISACGLDFFCTCFLMFFTPLSHSLSGVLAAQKEFGWHRLSVVSDQKRNHIGAPGVGFSSVCALFDMKMSQEQTHIRRDRR